MNFYRCYLYLLIILLISGFRLLAEEKHSRIESSSATDSISMEIWGEEIEIIGEKTGIGAIGGKITITPANISKLPSVLGGTDLLKLLELTPSVQNPGDANTNIHIRGGDAGQNLMLYNQVPLYLPGHLMGLFPLFNPDHISTLELDKTGIHAKYGSRLSSVINVESKSNIPGKTSITGNVGILASQATLAIPIGKKFGLFLSGRKTYLELFLEPLFDATVSKKNKVQGSGYNFYDTNVTLTGELSTNNKIMVNAFFGKDNLQLIENDIYLNGNLNWSNRLFALQWDTKRDNQHFSQQIYTSAYKNKLNVKQTETSIYQLSTIQDFGYKNNYTFFIDKVPVDIGMQYAFHEITPQKHYLTNMGQELLSATSPVQEAHDGALYVHSSIPLASQLRAELGVRYNLFYQDKFYNSLDPRITFRYYPKNQIALRLSYDRLHQYVNLLTPSSVGIPTDFWVAVSDKIPPQSGDQFSAGYTQSFPNIDFDISAEIYYRSMSNLTEYSQNFLNGQDDSYINSVLLGNGRAYGFEVMFKKSYNRLSGWISYALGRSERNFDEINNGKTFPARFDRRHDLSVVGTYDLNRRWDISMVYVFATGAAYTLPSSWYFINNTPVKEYGAYNGARMPNYNRMDLSVNYWFKKDKNGINLSIYNLFMINNPMYIVMLVEKNEKTDELEVRIKQKILYNIIPSISWKFKF